MQVLDVGPPEQNIADKVYASSAANFENKGPPHPNIDSQVNAAAAAQLEAWCRPVSASDFIFIDHNFFLSNLLRHSFAYWALVGEAYQLELYS